MHTDLSFYVPNVVIGMPKCFTFDQSILIYGLALVQPIIQEHHSYIRGPTGIERARLGLRRPTACGSGASAIEAESIVSVFGFTS